MRRPGARPRPRRRRAAAPRAPRATGIASTIFVISRVRRPVTSRTTALPASVHETRISRRLSGLIPRDTIRAAARRSECSRPARPPRRAPSGFGVGTAHPSAHSHPHRCPARQQAGTAERLAAVDTGSRGYTDRWPRPCCPGATATNPLRPGRAGAAPQGESQIFAQSKGFVEPWTCSGVERKPSRKRRPWHP